MTALLILVCLAVGFFFGYLWGLSSDWGENDYQEDEYDLGNWSEG